MSAQRYPIIKVFVTKSYLFRAKIKEQSIEPTYEVTIGGKEWNKGRGAKYKKIIGDKCRGIVDKLLLELKHTI